MRQSALQLEKSNNTFVAETFKATLATKDYQAPAERRRLFDMLIDQQKQLQQALMSKVHTCARNT